MSRRQAVRRAVEADIKHGLALVDKPADLLFIRGLGDQPSGLEFLIHLHTDSCPFRALRPFPVRRAWPAFFPTGCGATKKPPAAMQRAENPRYHLSSPFPYGNGLVGRQATPPRDNGRSRLPYSAQGRFSSRLRNVFPRPRAPPHTSRRLSAPRKRGYFFPSSPISWIKAHFFSLVKGNFRRSSPLPLNLRYLFLLGSIFRCYNRFRTRCKQQRPDAYPFQLSELFYCLPLTEGAQQKESRLYGFAYT